MGLKALVVVAILVVALGYMLYEPLPDTIPSPWKFRAKNLSNVAICYMVKLWAMVTGQCEWIVLRSSLSYIFPKPEPDPTDLETIKTEDTMFDNIPVRIYQPKNSKNKLPGLVYLHGGAFILGTVGILTSGVIYLSGFRQKFLRWQTLVAPAIIMSILNASQYNEFERYTYIEPLIGSRVFYNRFCIAATNSYRLAPEHKYPAGFEDCLKATKYFMQNAHTHGVDPSRIGVGGDSAGGNFAGTVALKLRDIQWKPQLRTQLLLYPVLQGCNDHLPVMVQMNKLIQIPFVDYRAVYMCNTDEECHTFKITRKYKTPQLQKLCDKNVNDKYIPKNMIPDSYTRKTNQNIGESPGAVAISKKLSDPYAFPLMAPSLRNLPRAYVFTAEMDQLRDDGIIYAKRMQEDGVRVDWVHYANTSHGTYSFYGTETYQSALQRLVLYLKLNL